MLKVSERRACKVLDQCRSTQRHAAEQPDDEKRLIYRIVELASKYGRYGYMRITALLRHGGWRVNHKRVERLWRREGLKVPKKQPKRGRLWLNDGSCVRLRTQYRNHVRSYDFKSVRTYNGRAFRILNVLEEYSRECHGCLVARRITHMEAIDFLVLLFIMKGVPDYIRSDSGPEFTAERVREWLDELDVKTPFIEPGRSWKNGYIESFNGRMRDELLNCEIFYTLGAQVLTEDRRRQYNAVRPHSSLGYRPPAPETKELPLTLLLVQ